MRVNFNWTKAASLEEAPEGLETYMPLYQVAYDANRAEAGLPYTYWTAEDAKFPSWFSLEDAGVDAEELEGLENEPHLFSIECEPQDSHLTDEQKQRLQALLDEFSDVFSTGAEDLGCATLDTPVFHEILLQPGAEPVKTNRGMHTYSRHELDFLSAQQEHLLPLGVIRPSTSAWVSAPVVVPKHDNTLRFCVDFRELNKVTMADPYPLPSIEQMIQRMSKAKYFTCMDIVSAFWQVPMHPKHIQYTAFMSPNGKFEWVRMPFGLKNASTTFQRFMNDALAGNDNAEGYVDDSFVFSETFDQHLLDLRDVLMRFRKANVKIKLPKCIFAALKIKCLGNIVSHGEVRPDPGKVMAITNIPPPRDPTGVRQFLGAASYYRNYIGKFAEIVAPMSDLTKKGTQFVWTPECGQAMSDLKTAMSSDPCLRLADFSQPFILTTDWSKIAIGAVLSQLDPETGEDHPIAFASRLLNRAERNYAPTEGECLAIVWAIQKFKYYLHGRRFTVYTDHTALTWLHTNRFSNSKLERWSMKLQEYDFVIKYKKGEDNAVADCLSRLVSPDQLDELSPEDYDIPGLPFIHHLVQYIAHYALSTAPHLYGMSVPLQIISAKDRREMDGEPCEVCGLAKGFDNLTYCHSCQRCFHLRCLVPPRSLPPSGDWYCPACDPFADKSKGGLEELKMQNTPLSYHHLDPYEDETLLEYVRSDWDSNLVANLTYEKRRELLRRAQRLKPHPGLDGWLLVLKESQKTTPRWLVCPPVEYRWDIIALVHDASGHAGINKTHHLLHMHYSWVGMKKDVAWFVTTCDACQRVKATHAPPLPLLPPEMHGPMQHVHIDLCGHFYRLVEGVGKREKAQKLWIVCMVDYFTKVVEVVPITNKSALTLAQTFYYSWICRYGVPSRVTSDNGTEFSTHFTHLLSRLRVKHIHTSVNHPSANGAVERFNQTLKTMITKHYNEHPNNWVETLPHFRNAYMSLPHTALGGHCPYEMLYGCLPRLPSANRQMLLSSCVAACSLSFTQHIHQVQDRKHQLNQQAELCLQHQFHRNAEARQRLLQRRQLQTVLQPGDFVLEISPVHHPLQPGVRGPFRVVELRHQGQLALLETGEVLGREKQYMQRHASHLVPYYHPHG